MSSHRPRSWCAPAQAAADRERLARFQREAEVLASLNHPHIAHVYGIEEAAGQPTALVMELVEGEDLAARLRRGAIPPEEALPIARQIAEALEAAHDAGIVHRDLKPENIMFRADDSLAIVDFGIAKMISDSNSLTQTGHILGTPYYLSPEQAQGEKLDGRSDLYSAGVMTFEMLTRRRPFTATTPIALVNKHIHEPIPRLPAGMERYQELIDTLMAKDRDKRFANAQQLLDYLKPFVTTA